MNKQEYINLLIKDNETNTDDKKQLYSDIIDCLDIALSQTSNDHEIDASVSLVDLYNLIESTAKKNSRRSVGPFEAAELIAEKLGSKYIRSSRKTLNKNTVNLEDFL